MGFLQSSLVFLLCAVAQGSSRYATASKIQWGPCGDAIAGNSTVPVECGDFQVPLDYTKPTSNQTLTLQLLRVPAAVQPSQGSIQINFGGPGEPGRTSLVQLGGVLQALSGGSYDLVAFDPRGTGNTLSIWCYENDVDMLTSSLEYQLGNSSEVILGRQWARANIEASLCHKNAAETGSLISTAFVARDLMQVAEALQDDGLLRYWGFSYGTTLGVTVAAMFPDRIEKMILDGVQNPHQYYHALADFEEWTDSDKVFSAIFTGCVASPENCAMAHTSSSSSSSNNSGTNATTKTAAELEAAVWKTLDELKHRPIALGGQIVLDYSVLKSLLVQNLYDAAGWPGLATLLGLLLQGDVEALSAAVVATVGSSMTDIDAIRASLAISAATMGIHCGERQVRAATLDGVMPAVAELFATSSIMGDVTTLLTMTCAQWQIEPRERYEGPLDGIRTRSPVLFVGNTYDGHTPLKSARNVSSGFEGSVVLEVNGYGHSSLAAPSLCTLQTTSAYWQNGTLPEAGTVCPVDMPLYSNITWADVIQTAAATGNDNSSSLVGRHATSSSSYEMPHLGRIFRKGLVW